MKTIPWCPICGPKPRVDEDGCCAKCGATVGHVPDAERLASELAEAKSKLEAAALEHEKVAKLVELAEATGKCVLANVDIGRRYAPELRGNAGYLLAAATQWRLRATGADQQQNSVIEKAASKLEDAKPIGDSNAVAPARGDNGGASLDPDFVTRTELAAALRFADGNWGTSAGHSGTSFARTVAAELEKGAKP